MYNWIARNILAPALDYSRGTRTMACLEDLEKSQWWQSDRVLELQNGRLRELVKHASENVPYYHRVFDDLALKSGDISCSKDVAKLPVLNKQLIRRNISILQATNIPKKKFILSSTSGSTGEPLIFYTTRDDEYNWGYARGLRARQWPGYQMGDKMAEFRPSLPNETALSKFINQMKRSFRRSILLEPQTISKEMLPIIARRVEAFKPKFLFGYPSAIYQLANYIRRREIGRASCRERVFRAV